VRRKGSSSFLKKRAKKLLFSLVRARRISRVSQHSKGIKVFCFFFSKKKYFLSSLVLPTQRHLPAIRA
jgi:hypothetical protein